MKYEGFFASYSKMLFVSKNISLDKVAFMNSSCCVICELNWIVFFYGNSKAISCQNKISVFLLC